MKMTQLDLMDKIATAIEAIEDTDVRSTQRAKNLENAEYIAKLAKQWINGADIAIRIDKMCGSTEHIKKIIGDVE